MQLYVSQVKLGSFIERLTPARVFMPPQYSIGPQIAAIASLQILQHCRETIKLER